LHILFKCMVVLKFKQDTLTTKCYLQPDKVEREVYHVTDSDRRGTEDEEREPISVTCHQKCDKAQ
jgi:hypothetical protein